MRAFQGYFVAQSGTSAPQNSLKYPPSGRDFIANQLT
jgi:hypothetical protein